MRSFFIVVITPLPLFVARASKLGGKRSNGLTNVRTVHGSDSGGVGSSMFTAKKMSVDVWNFALSQTHCYAMSVRSHRRFHGCSRGG